MHNDAVMSVFYGLFEKKKNDTQHVGFQSFYKLCP